MILNIDNQITDVGAKDLAAALLKNNTLKRLSLAYNLVKREGIEAFGWAISCNLTLVAFYMSCEGYRERIDHDLAMNQRWEKPFKTVGGRDANFIFE